MEQKGQHGSLTEILGRVNYYESAVKNPTKDPREARDSLYEELDRVGAFVTEGVTDRDFDRLNLEIGNLSGTEKQRATSIIGDLREQANTGEIGERDAIALITEPNSKQTVIIKVPSRR